MFLYKLIVENDVLTLTCIRYLRLKLTTQPIVIGEPEWCLMINGTENNIFFHKHNTVHFISTCLMSNRPPTFTIAMGN